MLPMRALVFPCSLFPSGRGRKESSSVSLMSLFSRVSSRSLRFVQKRFRAGHGLCLERTPDEPSPRAAEEEIRKVHVKEGSEEEDKAERFASPVDHRLVDLLSLSGQSLCRTKP